MRITRLRAVTIFLALSGICSWAVQLPAGGSTPREAVQDDARLLAAGIDARIEAKWAELKIEPARPADDAEFLRRVYLDLAGRIPSVAEARRFLADEAGDKREKLVDRLLSSPAYVNHFTNFWRAALLPETNSDFTIRFAAVSFDRWLRDKVKANAGYDVMVREILTADLNESNEARRVNPYMQVISSPSAYYYAKDVEPENLAAGAARVFLGIHLECAQCHDHPFAEWRQDQFWAFASFFAGLEKQGDGPGFAAVREISDRRELEIPGKNRVVQAAFPDGTEPKWKFRTGARVTLAEWMTARENPYFARAVVNRLWAHFFGQGLVMPVDNMDAENPPSHPQLLKELAKNFVAHEFDLQNLMKAIVLSKAYQLSSEAPSPTAIMSDSDVRTFGTMAVKGLSPEQIVASFVQATGYRPPENPQQDVIPNQIADPGTRELAARFAEQPEDSTERQTSILQALLLMNGKFTGNATSIDNSETLAAIIDAPFFDNAQRIETLYLATLTRKPRAAEIERLTNYVESGGPAGDSKKALGDVFWALLNSGEFILNH